MPVSKNVNAARILSSVMRSPPLEFGGVDPVGTENLGRRCLLLDKVLLLLLDRSFVRMETIR